MFEEFMSDADVLSYFETKGVKASSVRRIFHTLAEMTEANSVEFVTFLSTIVKLDGTASALDLHALSARQLHSQYQGRETHLTYQAELRKQHKMTQESHRMVSQKLDSLMQQLARNLQFEKELESEMHTLQRGIE